MTATPPVLPVVRPGFSDPCPYVPDGATGWEAQEIRRHWSNALTALSDIREQVHADADRLWCRGRWATPPEARHYDHRVGGGGLGYHAAQAEAYMVAMARVIDGCIHRQAVQSGEYGP